MLLLADGPNTSDLLADAPPSRYRLTPNVRAEAAERRRLVRDLGAATREGMLLLHYQPRLALDSGLQKKAETTIDTSPSSSAFQSCSRFRSSRMGGAHLNQVAPSGTASDEK